MRLRPTQAVRVSAVMCALTLTALGPFPLNPPASAGESAAPAAAPADALAISATTIDLLGITNLHDHISRIAQTDSDIGQVSVEDPDAVTLACKVFSARAANPSTLFVSAGDSVGGSTYISSILQNRPTTKALNAMPLDVSALGNHEFDQGLTDLEARILPASNFSISTANVSDSTPLSAEGGDKGAFIKEVGGVHVGFVSVVTDELPTLVLPSTLPTLTLSPAVATVNIRATELKDGDPVNDEADVAVVLSHGSAASMVTSLSKNVSAIFSGRTHVPFAKTVTGTEDNQIAVIQADHYGRALGRTRLSHGLASRKISVISADDKDLRSSSYTTDAYSVAGVASQAEKDSAAKDDKPLAKIDSGFLRGSDGSGPGVSRGAEFTASNLIAESFRSWLVTDIQPTDSTRYVGIMNPGGVRADLPYATSGSEGDEVLAPGEVYTVQPFGNEMAYATLTGAELKTPLSQQWQLGSSCPTFILGLSRNVNVLTEATTDPEYGDETEAAPTIREILVDDKPLANGDSVVITSNSSLLTGGDSYTTLKDKPATNTGTLDRNVTSTYLASLGSKPVTTDYSKRQTAMIVGPVYISSGGARGTDTVSMTLNSLIYTNPTKQATGARRVRVSVGDKEILTKNLNLTVSPAGPTAGRVDFNLTFSADAPTHAYRTVQAVTCHWALVETLDVAGTVLSRFSIEIGDEDAVGPRTDSDDSAATDANATADGTDGKAASTPQSNPDAGETSVGGSTEPSAGSDAQPAATTASTASGAPVQVAGPERPSQATSDSPLALTGASLNVGTLALALLVVGGYLILRRRQQVA